MTLDKKLPSYRRELSNPQSDYIGVRWLPESHLFQFTVPTAQLGSVRPGLYISLLNESLVEISLAIVRSIGRDGISTAFPLTNLTVQQLTQIRAARIRRAWSLSPQPLQLLDGSIFVSQPSDLARLDAVCVIKDSSHQPGLVSWSLFYRSLNSTEEDYREVIKGHDLDFPSRCVYTHAGLWQSGRYRITAQRFSSRSSVLVAQDQCNWALEASSTQLSCGRPIDVLPPLIL